MLFFSYLCALFCVVCAHAYIARERNEVKEAIHITWSNVVVGTPYRSATCITRFDSCA